MVLCCMLSRVPLFVCARVGGRYHAARPSRRMDGGFSTYYCMTALFGLFLDVRTLADALQGWWNKIVLFAPESGLRGRVLYIDLDTVVTASLEPVLSYNVCVCTAAGKRARKHICACPCACVCVCEAPRLWFSPQIFCVCRERLPR